MYKAYKVAQIAAASCSSFDSNESGLTSPIDLTLSPIDFSQMDSDKLWTNIDDNLRKYKERQAASNEQSSRSSSSDWLPVRIFVSSTFKDFFCEREILVKEVFPELREWCRERRIFLLECDLRWGVPKDSTNEDTVLACMTMLDQCNLETANQAFFLNLTGERYGWVPTKNDLPIEIFKRFDWVAGASVTLMEILIGAFRTCSRNALYMVRSNDPLNDWMADMPKKHLASFRESDPLPLSMIHRLRKEICTRFQNTDQLRQYKCTYAGLVQGTDGRDRVQIEGLQDFAKDILTYFKDAITRTYREHIDNVNNVDKCSSDLDNMLHEKLCGKLCYQVYGQNNTLNLLQEYVTKGTLLNNAINMDEIEKEDFVDGTPSLCLVGLSGSGKTVMLARLAQQFSHNSQICVFTHFVEASNASATDENLVERIRLFVTDLLKTLDISVPQSNASIISLFQLLPENPGFIVLLLVDGLELLLNMNMTWLPTNWPASCRCVVSSDKDNLPIMARLRNRYTHVIHIEELDLTSREHIALNFYADYGKKMDPIQLQSLIIRQCASQPLWLALACEELRLYGDYLTLTNTIKLLPDDVPHLITYILDRILKEDGAGDSRLISAFLKMLLIAREGIWEVCARGLLNHCLALDESNEINMAQWCTLLRKLNPFIQQTPGMGFVIKHKSTRKALENALFPILATATIDRQDEEIRKWHAYASEYYLDKCFEYEIRCRETPYHLYHAEKRVRLLSLLQSNDEIAFRMSNMTRGQIYDAWRCLGMSNLSQQSLGNRDPSAMLICCQLHNNETCLLCGRILGAPQLRAGFATLCMSHSSHQKTCVKCDRFIADVNRATRAYVCIFCDNGRNRCCNIITEKDTFHYSQHLRTSGGKRIFW